MKSNKLQVKDISDNEIYKAIKVIKGNLNKNIYDCLPYDINLISAKLKKMDKEEKITWGVSIAYPFKI